MLSLFSVSVRAVVIGLSQISSSFYCNMFNRCKLEKAKNLKKYRSQHGANDLLCITIEADAKMQSLVFFLQNCHVIFALLIT